MLETFKTKQAYMISEPKNCYSNSMFFKCMYSLKCSTYMWYFACFFLIDEFYVKLTLHAKLTF